LVSPIIFASSPNGGTSSSSAIWLANRNRRTEGDGVAMRRAHLFGYPVVAQHRLLGRGQQTVELLDGDDALVDQQLVHQAQHYDQSSSCRLAVFIERSSSSTVRNEKTAGRLRGMERRGAKQVGTAALCLGRSEFMSHRFKTKKPKALPSAEKFAARHGIRVDTARAIVEEAEKARNPRRRVHSN
jgi:hypothetical protein